MSFEGGRTTSANVDDWREVSGYRLRLASIWFTRPSTHRRTNSDKDKSIPFAQRLALASKEGDTFVVRVLVGFLAISYSTIP